MVIYANIDLHIWSCIPVLIFTPVHVSLCRYCHLVMYHSFDISAWLYVPMLILTYGLYTSVLVLTVINSHVETTPSPES